MNELQISIFYKIIIALVGLLIIFLGYVLFKKGYNASAGNLNLGLGDYKILLENTAPGIFFSLFGAIVIIIGIYKGIDIQSHSIKKSSNDKSLIIDTTTLNYTNNLLISKNKEINVDSIIALGQRNIKSKQYLIALKYLYFAQGILALKPDMKESIKKVNQYIQISERELSLIINNNEGNVSSEEIRSTKIKDEKSDSIR